MAYTSSPYTGINFQTLTSKKTQSNVKKYLKPKHTETEQ